MINDGCDFVVVRTQGLQGDRGYLELRFRNRADDCRVVRTLSESPVARPPLDVQAVPRPAQFVEEVCGAIL